MRKRHGGIIILHCKCRFGIVRMLVGTPMDLDLYLEMDQRQMKAIDVEYNVRVGYWTSRNNMQEYKAYATMIWMFHFNFMNNLKQVPRDNSWPIEPTNQN
jgi:hypothetical protein